MQNRDQAREIETEREKEGGDEVCAMGQGGEVCTMGQKRKNTEKIDI